MQPFISGGPSFGRGRWATTFPANNSPFWPDPTTKLISQALATEAGSRRRAGSPLEAVAIDSFSGIQTPEVKWG